MRPDDLQWMMREHECSHNSVSSSVHWILPSGLGQISRIIPASLYVQMLLWSSPRTPAPLSACLSLRTEHRSDIDAAGGRSPKGRKCTRAFEDAQASVDRSDASVIRAFFTVLDVYPEVRFGSRR